MEIVLEEMILEPAQEIRPGVRAFWMEAEKDRRI